MNSLKRSGQHSRLWRINTDVTVCRSEPDGDGYESFYFSETLMLSDDKEKFLSDFKLYLEDLERCMDFFIEQVKQQ